MFKFIKNFFQKKELWIFASYVGIDEYGRPMFGYLCWPYHTINKYNDLTTNIMAYGEEQGCKKGSVVILYFKTWKQCNNQF